MAPAVAAAAAANYSKLLGAGLNYPSIGNYRYTPYPLPSLVRNFSVEINLKN